MPQQDLFYCDSLQSLYRDVQLQEVFPDSKYFVDCVPKTDATVIVNAYQQEKCHPGFDIKKFVATHFNQPAEYVSTYKSANKPILQHLEDLWNELTRTHENTQGTLINLPFPYVVPGGRFREIYYWDSYFTMLGLRVSKRFDIIQNMIDNFAYFINRFGFIANGNRTYYLSRSQPPFFTLMVELLAEEKGETILIQYLPQIEKEYAFWMDGENNLSANCKAHRHLVMMDDGSLLNRYWDAKDEPRPEAFSEDSHIAKESGEESGVVYRNIRAAAESGWDFSSRWFRDGEHMTTVQTTNLVPVDLNCLLLHAEETLLKIYTLQKQTEKIELFTQKAISRKNAIQKYCWSTTDGFYFDYHFTDRNVTNLFTLAAVFPLFFSAATKEEAAQVALAVEEKFLQPGGLLTTLYTTGQQWDAPNGWAPLQWMTYKGLKNYGHNRLANTIKNRWMGANEKVYAQTGKMMEKYDVTDTGTKAGGGEYPNQDGFGWTNGVYLALHNEQ